MRKGRGAAGGLDGEPPVATVSGERRRMALMRAYGAMTALICGTSPRSETASGGGLRGQQPHNGVLTEVNDRTPLEPSPKTKLAVPRPHA